jgi:hypothetical protein
MEIKVRLISGNIPSATNTKELKKSGIKPFLMAAKECALIAKSEV